MLLIYSFLTFVDLLLIISRFFLNFYRIYSIKAVIIYPLFQFICIITFIIRNKHLFKCTMQVNRNFKSLYSFKCFVTIQNNILLKCCFGLFDNPFSFVTIQNNILLKLNICLACKSYRFVTIQNNILLKCQIRIL